MVGVLDPCSVKWHIVFLQSYVLLASLAGRSILVTHSSILDQAIFVRSNTLLWRFLRNLTYDRSDFYDTREDSATE